MAPGRGRAQAAGLLAASAAAVLVLLAPVVGSAPPTRVPEEGAWAEYALSSSGGAPDGTFRQTTQARLVLRFVDGAWTGTCSGQTTTTSGTIHDVVSFTGDSPLAPPAMPRLHRGEQVDPVLTSAAATGCRQDLGLLVVAGRTDGRTMLATEVAEASPYQDASLAWDPRTGLVQSWSFAGLSGGFSGRLVGSAGL